METLNKLSKRAQFVKTMLLVGVVLLACLSYFIAVYTSRYGASYPSALDLLLSREMLLAFLFISIIWSATETALKLNEVYRSRPYSLVLLLHMLETVVGITLFLFVMVLFGLPNYGRVVLVKFGTMSVFLTFLGKVIFYHILRRMRKVGRNSRKVIFVSDKEGENLLNDLLTHFEWGYNVTTLVGDDYMMKKYGSRFETYHINDVNLDDVLCQDYDDLIYAREYDNSQDILHLLQVCTDYGITFRLYSSFLNMISSSAYVRYFDTQAVLTISNTPTNYVGLLIKRLVDVLFSFCVIALGMPFFLIIALLIKLDSKGPVFFKQKRSGLKGKVFEVYKFRSMVVNAEELKKDLESKNEMTGPVFKMTDDPRITRMGKILRKSGIDEFPQFLNVLLGDMAIVGPRPPLPKEVEQYERWQMRRLAMKPGITCTWQVAPNRNSITFEEWMKMDMDYIDNWSLVLDFILIFKTVKTVFRADGK